MQRPRQPVYTAVREILPDSPAKLLLTNALTFDSFRAKAWIMLTPAPNARGRAGPL